VARADRSFPALTPEGLPNVRSASAYVFDAETGALIYAKNPDSPREIASTGKIFVAMAALEAGLDLLAETAIEAIDREAGIGGSRSRLPVGVAVTNRDLLAAMLVASDNRAPTALGRAVGLDPKGLVSAMDRVARRLGLRRTRLSDPVGLRGNVSTAREMALAFAASLRHPVLAEVLASRTHDLIAGARAVHYRNTNELLHRDPSVIAGKTGYTAAAGYCLLVAARVGERRIVMALLGGDGKKTRFADYRRIRRWLEIDPSPKAHRNRGPLVGEQRDVP
jgi:D-alanyl-D-alanine endopeptidase (penicillin-binding protein 7)